MQAIFLDNRQTTLVTQFRAPVPVRNQAGTLLGHIKPPGEKTNGSFDMDHWVECMNEWYSPAEEDEEPEPPKTD